MGSLRSTGAGHDFHNPGPANHHLRPERGIKYYRGILLAIYLHDLLSNSRGSSVEKTTDLDHLVLSWLDLMILSPTSVDFLANTLCGPGTQLQDHK